MTNACEHAVEYIYQYLDDEITFVHRSRIRWHLRNCNACCGAYEFETKLKAVVRERGRSEPSPELLTTLRALIEEERANSDDDVS